MPKTYRIFVLFEYIYDCHLERVNLFLLLLLLLLLLLVMMMMMVVVVMVVGVVVVVVMTGKNADESCSV
jgi:hypothetical protein